MVTVFNEELAKEQREKDERTRAGKRAEVDELLEKIDPGVVKRLTEETENGLQCEDCPICFESVLPGVVILPCGHPFCEECFRQLLGKEGNQECPNWYLSPT